MTGIEAVKSQMERYQSELKNSTDNLFQLKEAFKKMKNDIKLAQARVDTFNGAVQAADLAIKSFEADAAKKECAAVEVSSAEVEVSSVESK